MIQRIRPLVAVLVLVISAGAGLAVSLRDAHASGQTPQLPDLVADPPDNISISVSQETPTGEPAAAKLLLRFNGYLHNKGPGALDFRGKRSTPTDPNNLASPPMEVFQRIYEYETTEGPPPTSEETPHQEHPSVAKMEYVNADGHHHWHLQHVAAYSLWNAQKSAEVAPSQKVGFCMEDSEHVEKDIGPEEGVYVDYGPHPREFCRQYQPEATEVFEGISEGWRDVYDANLAYQWVDISDVLPGEYWLRAEVDPEHYIEEAPGEKPPAFAQHPTIVPGFLSQAQSRGVEVDGSATVTLTSRRWEGAEADEKPSPTASYEIVTQPTHGKLGQVTSNKVTYTPEEGYSGVDSFSFAARDPASSFPENPAVATVSIDVSDAPPSPIVSIEGAPTSVIAGTSIQLSAHVSNDAPEVTWSASEGTLTPTGPTTSTYTAPAMPPSDKLVTISAESPGGGSDQRTIEILPTPQPQPSPEVPVQPGGEVPTTPSTPLPLPLLPTPGKGKSHVSSSSGTLSIPGAMLIGRKLYMTARAGSAGNLRLSALLHGRRLGGCVARIRKNQSLTCTMTLPRGVSVRAAISVWATLRVGGHLIQTVRRAAKVPTAMAAMDASAWLGVKQAWRYFCGI